MKVVLEAKKVVYRIDYIQCPHCWEKTSGWLHDPRGTQRIYNCEFCNGEFTVPKEVEVVNERFY